MLSTLLHLLVIALIAMPVATHTGVVIERPQGAGGDGPVGGGGGGRRGTGGVREQVRYVEVATPEPAPPAPVATPEPKPVVVPPTPRPVVVPPTLRPVVPPPAIANRSTPVPVATAAEPAVATLPKVEATAPTPGTGGGTGRDGSTGTGPGTGGGTGSGVGTGRGAGTGPGTGGGTQANYPPTPTDVFIPPIPVPDKVHGFHLVAEYDVDETGKVLDFTFTPTRDGGYNRRLEEVLRSFKFRPGTTPDGRPVRMKAQIIYDF